MSTDYFVWIDVETSGLLPERDVLLEIAWVITPVDLGPIVESGSQLTYRPTISEWVSYDEVVRHMHITSGLFEHLENTLPMYGVRYSEVQGHILEVLDSLPDVGKLYLAGSSVHFDMSFLKKNMPDLAAKFSHRYYDISAVKLHRMAIDGEYPEDYHPYEPVHRALNDALNSLNYARLLQSEERKDRARFKVDS